MLKHTPLFAGLRHESLELLAKELRRVVVPAGMMLVREGDLANEMYLVLQGNVEVLKKDKNGEEVSIAELGAGDCFGEMAILDILPRSASVRALESSSLLIMSSRDLHEHLYKQSPNDYALFMMNIARELSRRLRSLDLDRANLRKVFGTVHANKPLSPSYASER